MHPAPSIILFTTLSGPGLGLAAIIAMGFFNDAGDARLWATALAIVMTGAGLISSVFHLRRPDRAWRAFSQWRSSWLSREGILAPSALGLLVIYVAVGEFGGAAPPVTGWITAAVCGLTVFATGMIYAQIKAVPGWHTPLTPALFLAFALAGGCLLALVVASINGTGIGGLGVVATAAVVVGWGLQIAWWRRLDRVGLGESNRKTATGIHTEGDVSLLQPPHSGANYLTSEMVFVVGRRHAYKLRAIAVSLGGVVPLALIGVTLLSPYATAGSFGVTSLHLLGVVVARWLFFAEARHTTSLYY